MWKGRGLFESLIFEAAMGYLRATETNLIIKTQRKNEGQTDHPNGRTPKKPAAGKNLSLLFKNKIGAPAFWAAPPRNSSNIDQCWGAQAGGAG